MSETLLSAVVNGTIISVMLAAAVDLSLRAIKHRFWNASIRYCIWCVTMAVTIGLPAIYLTLSPADLPAPTPELSAGLIRMMPAAINPEHNEPLPDHPVAGRSDVIPERTAARTWLPLAAAPIRIALQDWMKWVLILWAAVSLVMLGRLALSWLRLRHKSRRARTISLLGNLSPNTWLRKCGSTRQIRLAVSDHVSVPVAAGHGQPVILIPACLIRQFHGDELEQILIHEAAHLARFDDYTLLLQRVAEALFFFHPIVRWVSRRMSLEREIACDDIVVGLTGRARHYAKCLVRVAELASTGNESMLAPPATSERSELEARVQMLLADDREPWVAVTKLRLIAVFAVFAFFTWMASTGPRFVLFSTPAPERETAAPMPMADSEYLLSSVNPVASAVTVAVDRITEVRSTLPPAAVVETGNLGLDHGLPGQTPAGWHAEGIGAVGFQGTLVNYGCMIEGLQCLMINGPASPAPGWSGHVDTSFSPEPYLGRTVRLRAAVRVEGEGTSAWLWLRVSSMRGATTFFKNTADQPITSGRWNYYSIPAAVAENSGQISVGFWINGTGRVWVDDARLEPVDAAESEIQTLPVSVLAPSTTGAFSVPHPGTNPLKGTPVTPSDRSDISPAGSVDIGAGLGTLGEIPKDWRAGGFGAAGFSATLVDNGCMAGGSHCLMIKGATSPVDTWQGQIYVPLSAKPYLGKTVRLQTAIRVEGEDTSVWMYTRVDDVHGKQTWMISTEDHPITSEQWNYYNIPAIVGGDGSELLVGFVIHGTGRVFIDDARIEPFVRPGTK